MTAIYTKDLPLDNEDLEYFTRVWNKGVKRGLVPTGETIRKQWETGSEVKVVFKGRYTPYGCIRDCGNHYIEALYSSYRYISKDLMTIINDVEDK